MSLGAVDASLTAPSGTKNEVLSFFWKVSQ